MVFTVHVSLIAGVSILFFVLFLFHWIWAANHHGIAGVQYIYIYFRVWATFTFNDENLPWERRCQATLGF